MPEKCENNVKAILERNIQKIERNCRYGSNLKKILETT